MQEQSWTHFVGIGGAGMSGLAQVLIAGGFLVSGSDLKQSAATERLENLGAVIYQGHAAAHLGPEVGRVVVSTAIPEDNEEVLEAKRRGLPVLQRAELLGELMRGKKGIAVAGCHGKTTTTSMIALILEKSGWDPTVVVGGELNDIGGNAKLGAGELVVAEADESDGSFLKLRPTVTVVTNIDNDHLDYYGSAANLDAAFRAFVNSTPPEGFSVVCWDDPRCRRLFENAAADLVSYSLESDAAYQGRDVVLEGLGGRCQVFADGQRLGELRLKVPGRHNLSNALAAIAVTTRLGVDFDSAAGALEDFRGAARRFQVMGEAASVLVVDDYAHHPSEIRATLAAARQVQAAGGRVVVIFQPHRYTRTRLLADEFGPAFQNADLVIITDIYAAGEPPMPGVDSHLILAKIRAAGTEAVYCRTYTEVLQYVQNYVAAGDVVLTMGAGDIWKLDRLLLYALAKEIEQDDGPFGGS